MSIVSSTVRYEYIGAIMQDNEYQCGGVLLAPDKFVTTADCAYDAFYDDFFGFPRINGQTVVLDCLNLNAPLANSCDEHGISDLIFHPNYDSYLGPEFGYDIAIVVLDQPSTVKVPQILTHNFFNDELYVARPSRSFGYGSGNRLNYEDYEVLDMEVCKNELHFYNGLFHDTMLCARNTDPVKTTTSFDDGGPLIVDCGTFKVDLVLGLSSYQTGIASLAHLPDMFTEFQDSEIQQFLLDNIPIVGQFREYPDRVSDIDDVCTKSSGISGYIITYRPIAIFIGKLIFPYQIQQELEEAIKRWEKILHPSKKVVGNEIKKGTNFCGMDQFAFEETQYIDYVGIALEVTNEIEGLLSTDICLYEEKSKLPSLARILINEKHIKDLIETRNFGTVISHGIAAALGIGTSWQRFDLIQDPMIIEKGKIQNPDNLPKYYGYKALEHYLKFDPKAKFIPVDNELPGANELWHNDAMPGELMTINWRSENPPISIVTVAALEDLGFIVDYEAADKYDPKDYTDLPPNPVIF